MGFNATLIHRAFIALSARVTYNSMVKPLAALALLLSLGPVAARAQSAQDQHIPAGNAPVVRVQLRGVNLLTIRTWNREDVGVSSSVPLDVGHLAARAFPRPQINVLATAVQTPRGPLSLPPETFVLIGTGAVRHDIVVIRGDASGSDVTVDVPADTALVFANLGRGRMLLQNYRNGSFVARVHNGALQLDGVGGTGFAEVAKGIMFARASSFDRLRARQAAGKMLFEGCSARQIEATSIAGDIAYDNGTFAPGLARFESTSGNVAIGVASGGVQIGAHSSAGRIFSDFTGGTRVTGRGNDAQATVGGGGPVVTATSGTGAVYLYDGSLRERRAFGTQWAPVRVWVRRRGGARLQARPPIRGRTH